MNSTKLGAWLRKLPAGTVAITSVYVGIEGDEPVYTWALYEAKGNRAKEKTRLNETELAAEILKANRADCEDRRANCRYKIEALNDAGDVVGTKIDKVQNPLSRDPGDADPDASATGVVQQVLRHNEAVVRMYIASQREIHNGYQELLRIQQSQIQEMRAREKSISEIIMQQSTQVDEEQVAKRESIAKVTDALATEILPRAGMMIDVWARSQAAGKPPGEGVPS